MIDDRIYLEVSEEIAKMHSRKRIFSIQRAYRYFRYNPEEEEWFDEDFKVTWSRRDCFHLLKIRDVAKEEYRANISGKSQDRT